MESLNLNTLASSLPTANLQNAEKELLNNFKGEQSLLSYPSEDCRRTNIVASRRTAAALSITTLYRSSRHTSKRAYNAGYTAACQDLLVTIQQGVSAGGIDASGSHGSEGGGMTIGRVMDWIEARLDAIKSREEEEDEDEERERERDRGRATANAPAKSDPGALKAQPATNPPPSPPSSARQKEYVCELVLIMSHLANFRMLAGCIDAAHTQLPTHAK